MLQSRLADARAAVAAAQSARVAAEGAMQTDILTITPADFAERRAAVVAAREQEAAAQAMVEGLIEAEAALARQAVLQKIGDYATEYAAMTEAAAKAVAAYRAAADVVVSSALEIEAIQQRDRDIQSELFGIWTNDIAASFGAHQPRLGMALPDVGALRLPGAAPDGSNWNNPRGSDEDAGWHHRNMIGAQQTADVRGFRKALRVMRR